MARPGAGQKWCSWALLLATIVVSPGMVWAEPLPRALVLPVAEGRRGDAALAQAAEAGLIRAVASTRTRLVPSPEAARAMLSGGAKQLDCLHAGIVECRQQLVRATELSGILAATVYREGRGPALQLQWRRAPKWEGQAASLDRVCRHCRKDLQTFRAFAFALGRELLGLSEATVPTASSPPDAILPGPPPAGMLGVPSGIARLGLTNDDLQRAVRRCMQDRQSPCPASWFKPATPMREARVAAFFIDRREVTAAEWAQCRAAGACPRLTLSAGLDKRRPRTGVSLADAERYCRWAGKRLPTEDEWEWAARGPEGGLWPWGSQAPDCTTAAFGRGELAPVCAAFGASAAAPVGTFPLSTGPFGTDDQAGNVWEWVQARSDDPELPPAHGVVRGGAYYLDAATALSAFRLYQPAKRSFVHTGFRCAKDAPAMPQGL